MPLGKGLNSLIPQQKTRNIFHRETGQADAADAGERIWQVPVTDIAPNEHQPRKFFNHQELEDLTLSIKEHGVLQPISVTEKMNGGYELIAGERRLRAATMAGLATIPAIVRKATNQEKLELALIENIQRADLNPIEEAFAYKRLIEEFHLSHDDVAKQVGKSRPVISNMVRLLDLPEQIQKALMDGTFSSSKARALLSLKDPEEQIEMFSSMMGQKISSAEVERRVAAKGQASRKGSVRRDPNLSAQEQLLESRLGTKVSITRKGERGRITIDFFSSEEFQRLMQELT